MVQLTADDPDDVCAYEFDEEQVVLAPGQQKDVDFLVNPKKGSPFGSTRLIGFAITGRSLSNQGVVASSQGQLEIRPLFTPVNVTVLVAAFLIILTFLFLQPKQPTVRIEQVGKSHIFEGGTVTVHWVAEHANTVTLIAGGIAIKEGLPLEGQEDIPAKMFGTLTFEAVAIRDKRQTTSDPLKISVEVPIVIPDPEIVQLEPQKKTVNKGEKFTLNYRFKNTNKATLSPQGTDLNLTFNSQQFDAGEVGENTFTVAAYNSANKVVKKTFTVKVVDQSLAKIVKFELTPLEVDPNDGKVNISWQVADALRIVLTYDGQTTPYVLDAVGSKDFQVVGKTTFTITAYDNKGKSTVMKKTVTIKPPDPPADNNAPPTNGTAGSAGTTTG